MKKITIAGIYYIQNKVNGKRYIGSSVNLRRRISKHFSLLANNRHHNHPLQNAYNKYGPEKFIYGILEVCNKEDTLTIEQCYLNTIKFSTLYNTSREAGTGGGDTVRKELYLLNLKGGIVKRFPSGTALAEYFGVVRLNYSGINTEAITRKKYRIVTPDFYDRNKDVIKSWKTYSNASEERTRLYLLPKYSIEKENEKLEFNTVKDVANVIGITQQRANQIYKSIENQVDGKYLHKKSGYIFRHVRQNM